MVGTTLSHYRIVSELGRGGMGIVYKAEDTKLDRTVALKILPASALTSEDDRARFYREAKAAAQLNHPHIAAIHEIDEAVPDGGSSEEPRPFIAMEFIDGETLQDRAKAGPMNLEEAVRITSQIASALEAAHEKNIVHRDIKSANVMMTSKGSAKVLDFGLAKTAHSTMLTRMGSTLGTAAYMSPEQARGENVDHRTDLWALGVLMYELIAGRLPFGGDYEQAVTYSILNEDPDPLTSVRTGVPMSLEWIVSKLLAKKADDRYQSAKDLIVDLRTVDLKSPGLSRTTSVASMPVASPATVAESPAASKARTIHPAILVAAVLLAIAAGFWTGSLRRDAPGTQGSMKRLTQSVPLGGVVATLDISPQGDKIFFATDLVRVLDLNTGNLRDYDVHGVFVHSDFSADGQEILLTTAVGIDRLSLTNGSLVNVITPSEGGPRAEWVTDDYILYEERTTVYGMSLTTNETRQIITLDSLNGQYDIDYPSMLPGGKTIVATAQYRDAPDQIGFWDLESGRNRGYINLPGLRVQWIEPGYLVFSMDGNAMALPFDADKLVQAGPIVQLERDVRPDGLSVSREGTLVHVGQQVGQFRALQPTVPGVVRKVGASTEVESVMDQFPPAVYRNAVIHPSENKAAVVIQGERGPTGEPPMNIWILDFDAGTRRPLTSDGLSDYPAWNSTGDSLYYIYTENNDKLMVMSASGRGGESTIMDTATPSLIDLAVSHDGRWAAMGGALPPSVDAVSSLFLWDLRSGIKVQSDEATLDITTPNGNPRSYDFSPSGKYLVYEDQGGIYVQSLDDLTSTPFTVWESGMTLPKWAPDESKLYARTVEGEGRSIRVQMDPVFSTLGLPDENDLNWQSFGVLFDVFPDGERFLNAYLSSDSQEAAAADSVVAFADVHFIINLPAGLK